LVGVPGFVMNARNFFQYRYAKNARIDNENIEVIAKAPSKSKTKTTASLVKTPTLLPQVYEIIILIHGRNAKPAQFIKMTKAFRDCGLNHIFAPMLPKGDFSVYEDAHQVYLQIYQHYGLLIKNPHYKLHFNLIGTSKGGLTAAALIVIAPSLDQFYKRQSSLFFRHLVSIASPLHGTQVASLAPLKHVHARAEMTYMSQTVRDIETEVRKKRDLKVHCVVPLIDGWIIPKRSCVYDFATNVFRHRIPTCHGTLEYDKHVIQWITDILRQ
jgi:hypothetical protein